MCLVFIKLILRLSTSTQGYCVLDLDSKQRKWQRFMFLQFWSYLILSNSPYRNRPVDHFLHTRPLVWGVLGRAGSVDSITPDGGCNWSKSLSERLVFSRARWRKQRRKNNLLGLSRTKSTNVSSPSYLRQVDVLLRSIHWTGRKGCFAVAEIGLGRFREYLQSSSDSRTGISDSKHQWEWIVHQGRIQSHRWPCLLFSLNPMLS